MDCNSIKRRFLALNRDRLQRITSTLLWRQRDFLDLLPLLFHINDPSLPGYVTDEVPAGISNYRPGKQTLEAACRVYKRFKHSSRALSRYAIQALFLTGSSGTIAHAKNSDFDIWVCHRTDLDDAAIALLEEKASAISRWCTELNLEVHFFLMDEQRFRHQKHQTLNKEHSGSAQHLLLLEEFYRSSVLLAGCMPLWWFIPPEEEHNYTTYAAELIKTGRVAEYEVIDFGAIHNIPAEEFFGASLWQIYKGIDSPYKSVLKILLMEAYASEYPNIDLLCLNLKRAIYENRVSLAVIDPYIMICHKVEEYLLQRAEKKRLELARRCFYFKADIRLSKTDTADAGTAWRRELLRTLVNQWGWDDAHMLMLDSRPTWKIHRVLDERKSLVDELTRSYKLLSGFAREYSSVAHINQQDMTILGRKLYAAFERKAGKIETVNPDISDNLVEEQLSFHESTDSWLLFRGNVTAADTRHNTPLKRSRSIVELLCWCHFNHLIGHGTITSLYPVSSRLGLRELNNILATLNNHFPAGRLPDADMSKFSQPSHMTHSIMFVNVGIDPDKRHLSRDVQIISDRSDAFSYSSFLENLVVSIDHVSINSWQEVYTQTYHGIDRILECLCHNVKLATVKNSIIQPEIHAYSFSSTKDTTVSSRIENIFQNVISFFHRPAMPVGARYILGVENNYYILQNNPKRIEYHRVGNYDCLIRELCQSREDYRPIIFDSHTLGQHFLPLLYAKHELDSLNTYIHINGKTADIYIIDEHGTLFYQQQDFFSLVATTSQFDSFFYSIKQRMIASGLSSPDCQVNFFSLQQQQGQWHIKEYLVDPLAAPANALHVTVLIDNINEPFSYRVYCDDMEFSSLQYQKDIFDRVADYIISLRHERTPYALYITDIDIPSGLEENIHTHHYLRYKQQFEVQLNNALVQAHRRNIS
ncbi:class I adenylate cyclase [Sulfuriflexus mobilis]|uniref:class I adenylate cyclase n=1 Tax=Sulfuriflexus mobilis TaxID=1811807 RepID=UPI000F8312AB|nr:class I adenylate cyclase [Sulfuriflexus mobilis]